MKTSNQIPTALLNSRERERERHERFPLSSRVAGPFSASRLPRLHRDARGLGHRLTERCKYGRR